MTIGRRGVLVVAIAVAVVPFGAGSASALSTLAPTDFDFGNQTVGTTSAPKEFGQSIGETCIGPPGFEFCFPDLLSPIITLTGPFTQTNNCSPAPFASNCTLNVAFVPTSPGAANGTLTTGAGAATLRGNGLPAPVGSTQASKPSNQFGFGKLKLNKNNGSALITIDVPGAGNVALGGNGVVKKRPASGTAAVSKAVGAAGKVTLLIKSKGSKKAKLNDTGKVTVKPKITFTPTGGIAATQTKTVTLKKNL